MGLWLFLRHLGKRCSFAGLLVKKTKSEQLKIIRKIQSKAVGDVNCNFAKYLSQSVIERPQRIYRESRQIFVVRNSPTEFIDKNKTGRYRAHFTPI